MTEKQCHKCGKIINDIMFWDNGEWCYCLDCSNKIIQELYGEQQMTEKRFQLIKNFGDYYLTNGDKHICFDICSPTMAKENWNNVVNELNRLDEENQLLKNKLEFFNELNKPYSSIIKENKELKNKLHFVMKRLNEKDRLLAKVLEVNKNLEKKLKK